MWSELRKALALFPTVVLNWVDENGYPASARIAPRPDARAELLRFDPPAGLVPREGPASILGHSHNEQTWNLKAFLARGRLDRDASGWVFRPSAFIPGQGIGSPLDEVKGTLGLRRTAKRYLERRGLSRPAIPWDKINSSH